ncbi:hypothetical protein PGT21_016448 [Puccinia graminis f. sp. tritici]|uniref:Uncharacterized protein n=1 Tax=Puccinia graminis f. sp. tritici TaxID=56615 RepID=A0A5B0MTZ0_PUCGR|nr:hypothetical protein PGT21_016448 [Puccinia graminis f. sp. tritici]
MENGEETRLKEFGKENFLTLYSMSCRPPKGGGTRNLMQPGQEQAEWTGMCMYFPMERRPELGPMAEVWVTRPRPCCASPASSTECAVACRVSSLERILMEPGDETETHHTTERPTSTFPEPGSNRPMDELMRAIGFGDFLGLTCLSPSLVYALPRKPANGTTALYKGVLPPGGEVSRHPIAVNPINEMLSLPHQLFPSCCEDYIQYDDKLIENGWNAKSWVGLR